MDNSQIKNLEETIKAKDLEISTLKNKIETIESEIENVATEIKELQTKYMCDIGINSAFGISFCKVGRLLENIKKL